MVNMVITQNQIKPELTDKLRNIFPRETTRNAAHTILKYLRENPPANQKTIAKTLNYSQKKVGNILKKLQEQDLILKRKGYRNENIYTIP